MSSQNKLGARVSQLRQERQLSVEQLAEQSGCEAEQIRQLEAGALVPSLTPLMNICRALGVRLGTLLDDEPHDGPAVVKKGDAAEVIRFSGKDPRADRSKLDFSSLGAGKKDRHMEPFVIEVQPLETDAPLSSHEGEEFLYILDGTVEVLHGRDRYRLEAGESIYYDSVVPHDVHAVDGPARMLAVVYTPA